ncbi:hypothetical protein [Desulfuribacillus alkaliarsenatis]|uniref:Flagellar hook-length control protein-like C-terminal domain-containing protein n=1 Tax=Desulfuribacillus alkaliarsenatis TaxID=766136 RepID=A0A1E5G409_9FIRM|nr:hypothetical protein [Desulfuribacillus alkaliarsenatis]OEF97820.1 hypothetical protein BHF68_13380 [Desulfuribacillus alkaliarsenatis]
MEITSQIAANGRNAQDNRAELRPGQVVSVNVKERISDREAIVSVRGQEIRATFEGKMPQGERMLVEVRSNDAQGVTVRAMDDASVRVSGRGSVDADIQQIARQFGEKLSPDLRQALRIVVDSGTPLSKELVQHVRAFLDTRFDAGSGNPSQIEAMNRLDNKLATLQAAVGKNLNISNVHLQAIHEALHGSNLADAVKNLRSELGQLQRDGYVNQELLQSLTSLNTKDFLISVVTKKMAEVGNEFRDLRRDITKNINNVIRTLETGVRGAEQAAQRMIEPTIQMLERAILKSDMFLFTDMKTEKKLMKATADLEAARALLAKGDRQAALKLVQQVQDTISNLKWKPSADRVQRFVMEGQQQLEQLKQIGNRQAAIGDRQLTVAQQTLLSNTAGANQYVLGVDKDTMSARQVFDFMRSLGLNHESEAAQRLVAELSGKGTKGNSQANQLPNTWPTARNIESAQATTMQLTREAQELLQRPVIRDAIIQALNQPRQGIASAQANMQAPAGAQQQVAAHNMTAAQIQVQLLSQLALYKSTVTPGGDLQTSLQELQRTITGAGRQEIPQDVMQRVSQLEQNVRQLDQFKQQTTNTNVDPRILAERNQLQQAVGRQMTELLSLVQRQESQQSQQSQQLQANPAQNTATQQTQQQSTQQQPVANSQQFLSNMQQMLTKISTATRQGTDVQPLLQELHRSIINAERQGMPQQLMQKLEQLERNIQQTDQLQRTEQVLRHIDPKHRSPQLLQQLLNHLQGEAGQQKNLKTAVMELIKQNVAQRALGQQNAEQTLAQLTGQQLLSKGDSQSNNQSMFFQLPVAFQEQINNLKVFINGKGKREKIDWENCSLYFLLETKKLGEIGIQISATNRNLSVTVKNDTPGLQRFFDPLIERFKEQLDEVGYHIMGVKFSKLTEEKEKQANPSKTGDENGKQVDSGTYKQKGFDLKI